MKKYFVIIISLLTISLVGCGAKETNGAEVASSSSVESRSVEATPEPTEAPTPEPTETPNQGTSNGGSLTTEFEKAPETICILEDIEPTTMYAKGAGMLFYDPNFLAQDPTATTYLQQTGAYEAGQEFTFTQKTTYENVEYYVYTRRNGLIVIAEASKFQSTPLTAEELASAQDMQDPIVKDKEELSDAEWDAVEAEALKALGYTDEQIDKFINPDKPTPSPNNPVVNDDLGPKIGPSSADENGDASGIDWDNGGDMGDLGDKLDGMLNG